MAAEEVLPKENLRTLSDEALEVMAMRACRCQRMHTVGLIAGPAPPPYTCLAHRAIDELEKRERRQAQHG